MKKSGSLPSASPRSAQPSTIDALLEVLLCFLCWDWSCVVCQLGVVLPWVFVNPWFSSQTVEKAKGKAKKGGKKWIELRGIHLSIAPKPVRCIRNAQQRHVPLSASSQGKPAELVLDLHGVLKCEHEVGCLAQALF
jgi:hypothetical protein